MTAPTQQGRQISISVNGLAQDTLLFHKMTAKEELGRLFKYDLVLLSTDHNIQLKTVLGQNTTIKLEQPDGSFRYFNGHISRFTYANKRGQYARYLCTVRPRLWFLTLRQDCRVYQTMKVPDIILEVLSNHGVADYVDRMDRSKFRDWDYCVQYRETDFDFISRLMEQEGIYYYFKHSDGQHVLQLCDGVSDHIPTPGYEVLTYNAQADLSDAVEWLKSWSVSQQVAPAGLGMRDFNFRTYSPSSASIHVGDTTLTDFIGDGVPTGGSASHEIYDYPGEFETSADGTAYVGVRMEEMEAQHKIVTGRTTARGLAVGSLFEIESHPRTGENSVDHLVLSATYKLESDQFQTGGAQNQNPLYVCTFRALDAARTFRTPRTTPTPTITGPQTATVVGPTGTKVYTDGDGYGQVKVRFHWDRRPSPTGQPPPAGSATPDQRSCWVRVSQAWAGSGWGSVHLPHVGQEVIVEFLEGDPDRPIITGRVYNDSQKPPREPGVASGALDGTKSIIRDVQGNKLVFDATPGSELITLHCPRNNSGLELGDTGFCLATGSDAAELFVGAKTEILGFTKTETVVGSVTEGLLGFSSEFKVASSLEAFAGSSIEIKHALNYEISNNNEVRTAEADWLQLVHGDAILDSKGDDQGKLLLCSGSNRESVVDMNADSLSMYVGCNNPRYDEVDTEPLEKKIKIAVGVAATAHIANSAAAIVWYAGFKSAWGDAVADVANTISGAATHTVNVASHIVAMYYAWKLYSDQQQPNKIKDQIADAVAAPSDKKVSIRMTKRDGKLDMLAKEISIRTKSDAMIQIEPTLGNVFIDTPGEITLKSNSLKGKNKQVKLGAQGELTIG